MRLGFACFLTLLGAACVTPTAAPSAPEQAVVDAPESHRIDRARQAALAMMVKHDCGSCHGLTLKGGLGKPLVPERMEALPVDTLAALILGGIPGTAMPPWSGLINEDEARWIAAGLRQGAFQ